MAISKLILNGTTQMDVTGTTATPSDVANGKTFIKADGTTGTGTASMNPNLQSKSLTVTPSETGQVRTITPDSGYDGLSSATVSVDAISSSYVGSGIARRSSSNLSLNDATVTAPSGYYAEAASRSVAMGTAGTPVAEKLSVQDHAIDIIPSVVNTKGYIYGGTITGSEITVTAAELVSGTRTITENGTGIDVTNYASVDVNVATSSAHTGTITQGVASFPRIKINGTGTRYYKTGDTFTFEEGDYLAIYCGSSSNYNTRIYVNGVRVYNGLSPGTYNYTPPAADVEFEMVIDGDAGYTEVYITYPYLTITANGVYDTSGYGGVVVNIS